MCRISGYIGKRNALPIVMDGLRRQSYGGYDSSGIAILNEDKISCFKSLGKLENLEKKIEKQNIDGMCAIGHIRWASHGLVTEENAHPHKDCKGNIYLVHNGIIENHQELKDQLIKQGHKFYSETDSEVLCHLIEEHFKGNLENAVRKALLEVRGTYGLLVISRDDPGKIVAARLSSPLLIGINKDEYIVASDPTAIIPYAQKVISLDDYEIAIINPENFLVIKEKKPKILDLKMKDIDKGDYPHFMIKEIMEEPRAIERAIKGRLIEEQGLVKLGGLDSVIDKLFNAKQAILIGCGTAYYASMIGEYMLEEIAGISSKASISSEFSSKKTVIDKNAFAVFVSQSGETADTLSALREIKKRGILTIGITNVVGSTQTRETDAGVYIRSGPEISVASTKAFVSQVTILLLFSLFLARQREMSLFEAKEIINSLKSIPILIEKILSESSKIKDVVDKYSKFDKFMFLGRKYNYPVALEGALKLKEVSYCNATSCSGGEIKHGPLALIDKDFPSFAICPSDSTYAKMKNSIEAIKARRGLVIAIATEGNKEIKKLVDDVIYIPETLEVLTPILSVVPLHLFAYYMAIKCGCDVDKPRNLAKSVTVE